MDHFFAAGLAAQRIRMRIERAVQRRILHIDVIGLRIADLRHPADEVIAGRERIGRSAVIIDADDGEGCASVGDKSFVFSFIGIVLRHRRAIIAHALAHGQRKRIADLGRKGRERSQ